jgi:hypothetical protein
MEQANCAACILGVLFHEEDILRDLLWMEIGLLLVSMLSLNRCAFIQEQDTQDRFGDHFEGPFFSREHLLEREEIGFESHFLHKGIDDFWVGLKWQPVLFVCLLHVLKKI